MFLRRGYNGVSLLLVEKSDVVRVFEETIFTPFPQQFTYDHLPKRMLLYCAQVSLSNKRMNE